MLAFLFLLLAFERLNIATGIGTTLGLDISEQQAPDFFDRVILFSNLSLLLYAVPVLLCFTNRTNFFAIWLERAAFAWPMAYIIAYVISGKINDPSLYNTFFLAAVFYLISVAVYIFYAQVEEIGKRVVDRFARLGSISYGLYIIHFPILYFIRATDFPSDTVGAFWVRLFIFLALVIAGSWLLERRFQPFVNQIFFKKK